jgi:hypothetical protein
MALCLRYLKKIIMSAQASQNKEPIPINFEFEGKTFTGLARPSGQCQNEICSQYDLFVEDKIKAELVKDSSGKWIFKNIKDEHLQKVNTVKLAERIGDQIGAWYDKK